MYYIYCSVSHDRICTGDIAKVFSSTQRSRRIRRNSRWQERLLYLLFLQEDLYGIAYNRLVGGSNYRRKKFFGLNNKFDFLTLKRLIKKLRRSDYLCIVPDVCVNEFRVIQEIVTTVFNLILPTRSKPFIGKTNEWNGYQSIHSVFPPMEDNICNFNNCLDFTIPYFVHPEILIRAFRPCIWDISFLHFLRVLLHQNNNLIILNPPTIFYSKENQFHRFLWNFYIYKFEYSLLNTWKRFYLFRSTPFWFSFDRISFVRKIRDILEQTNSVGTRIVGGNNSIHYVRYRNDSIIGMGADTELLIENWRIFLNIIWGKHFHFWFEPHRISVINSFKSPLSLLGYTIRTKIKSVVIRVQLVHYSIDTNLITREFCSFIPVVPLIGLLAKEKFCDISGRPICKLPWTTLADNEIFEKFDKITKSISCYYGGCSGKKGLYQLQYILRFSCAKTSACKHKSTIRTVWKKYGSSFATNFVFSKEAELVSSNSWQIDSHERKFWYLNIIQINYFSNLLQKLRDVRDFEW